MKKIAFLLTLVAFATANLTAQWALQKTNAGNDYNTLFVDVVSKDVVWATLEQNVDGFYFNPVNKVVRSIDGGKNWTTHTVTDDPSDFLTSITARSASEAWVTTFSYSDFSGGLYRTTNGGQTFTRVQPDMFSGPGNYVDFVHFFDDQHGLVLGDPIDNIYQVFTTSDGGTTWTQSPDNAGLAVQIPGEFGYSSTYAVTGNTLMTPTIGNNRLLRTEDFGQTWTSVPLPSQPANTNGPGGVAFADAMNGLLVYNYNPDVQTGGQPKPLRTTDGGLTWTVIEESNGDEFDEYGNLVHVPGTASTFLAGNFDGTAYTKDFGITWVYKENNNFRVADVDCLNANTCYGSIWHDSKNTGSKVARWVGNQLATPNTGPYLKMKASPNPATGPVTVTFSSALPADGLIYILDNANTTMVAQLSVNAGQTSATFNIGNFKPGMYWLKAVVGSQVFTEKFFKK